MSSSSVVFVSQIVDVLILDAYIIDERTRLIDFLDTPPAERKIWEDLHVMGTTSGYQHFSKLIQEWVLRTTPSLKQLRQILKSCGFISALDSLKSLGDDDTIIKINQQCSLRTSNAICFGLIQPTTFFTGRDAEVQQLSELFLNQSPPKIVVISGMGGQGKTELCRQFIKTLQNQNYPPSLAWLSGDDATNLTSSFVQLAQSLQISTIVEGKPIPLTQLFVQVANKISAQSSSSGWLVVIDNVDEVFPQFKQAVHLLVGQGAFVLITTRRIDVLSGQAKQIKLGIMKEDEAHNLVRKCFNQLPPIDDDVHNLCNELGNHVLALRHAVAYINAQQVENRASYGINDYLNDFAKDKKLLNDEDNFVDGYDSTVFLIVTRAMKTIHDKHGRLGRKASELMEILYFVRPDRITVECLQKFQTILEATKTQKWYQKLLSRFHRRVKHIDLNQPLLLLKKYSLITFDDGSSISIHRLVQKVGKCHCGSEAIKTILKTIEPEQFSKEELQQIVHLWEQADPETVKEFPNLASHIFHRMHYLSLVLEMRPFAERNYQLFAKLLGPNDKYTLFMQHNVAFSLKETGDFEAALVKFHQVLQMKKGVFGEEHVSTLVTASQLANVYHKLNRFEEALEWNEMVLESQLRLKVLGSNHKDTMTTRHRMAMVLDKLGRTDEARTLYNQVLEWRMENQGHSHPDTLTIRHNMGVIMHDQGQLQEAQQELEAVLNLKVAAFGDDHAITLRTKGCLASTLWKLGRREEAMRMNQEVLVSQEKVLGTNHPDTITTREEVSVWEESYRS